MKLSDIRNTLTGLTALGLSAIAPSAFAGNASAATGMMATGAVLPWDGPIASIIDDLSGPMARGFVIVAIVVTGLMWSFGEHGSSMRKVMGIAAGGALALGAVSFIGSGFFGAAGATVGM